MLTELKIIRTQLTAIYAEEHVTRGMSLCSSDLRGSLSSGFHAQMSHGLSFRPGCWHPLYYPGLTHIGTMNVRPTAYRRRFQHPIGCNLPGAPRCNPQVTRNGSDAARMHVHTRITNRWPIRLPGRRATRLIRFPEALGLTKRRFVAMIVKNT